MKEVGFKLYLLFIISWFLHLTSRVSILGSIGFDLILILGMAAIVLLTGSYHVRSSEGVDTQKILFILIIYILVTMPFVEWPGTVLKKGIPNFVKAIVFYFFTISFVDTEKKLRLFIMVVVACLSFRALEPLYLHITEGYWGSAAYAQGEFMNRLAGAPHDVVNPNGLAVMIDSVIPFLYFLAPLSVINKLMFILGIPPLLYALVLTGSRSGMIGLMVIMMGCIIKSKHRALLTALVCICSVVAFLSMSSEQQDRYLSIIDPSARHAATSRARVEGIFISFEAALKNPLFGHGLGSSGEATFHFRGEYKLAHNLYAEVAQELGFVGLVIYLFFMKTIIVNFTKSNRALKESFIENSYLKRFNDAMQVWLWMNIIFSFASFGLSTYIWYLFAGLSVVIVRLSTQADSTGTVLVSNTA